MSKEIADHIANFKMSRVKVSCHVDVCQKPAWDFLTEKSREGDIVFIITWEGVLWGHRTTEEIIFSELPPDETYFVEGYAFSETQETYFWREADGIHYRSLHEEDTETDSEKSDYYEEDTLLYGSMIEATRQGFTLLSEGAQGLRHAVPMVLEKKDLPLRLTVRHYLADEPTARVEFSRLIALKKSSDKGAS
jgi:CRISPR-associated protein (TIGR03984 family)